MKYGSFLRRKREKLGLSQKQVALKLNISRQAISNWEHGKSHPDFDLLSKIFCLYQCNEKDIAEFIHSNYPRSL
jgi:transcriptional regulator with XRE-family HTH domain